MAQTSTSGWLWRLGLHRPELRAWAMYDWANSAFMTTIIAAIFPVYFSSVAAIDLSPTQKLSRFSFITAVALTIVAVISPVLGAVADYAGIKKKLLAAFLGLGVVATGCMYFIGRGDWVLASVLFILGNIGVSGSFVFYDSLLPHIARDDELDRVSSAGYALGYLGGGLLLALNVAWILRPNWFGIGGQDVAARLSFLSVAIWWLGFSIPLFLKVPEPPRNLEPDEKLGTGVFLVAFGRVGETFRELRVFKNAFIMLVAFLIYNDGIGTIIRIAAAYAGAMQIPQKHIISAILLVQFIGIPFAFLFGDLAGRIGAKRAIFLALVVYTGISVLGYSMKSVWEFYLLSVLVGMVQGGSQALSRSMFASMIPRHKSSEFFAFFGIFEKFAGIIGPMIFSIATAATSSGRLAILSVIAFFVVGGGLLRLVNVAEGQRIARDADASARLA